MGAAATPSVVASAVVALTSTAGAEDSWDLGETAEAGAAAWSAIVLYRISTRELVVVGSRGDA